MSRTRRVLYLSLLFVLVSQFHPSGYGNPFDYGANCFRIILTNMSFSLFPWGIAYFVSQIAKKVDFTLRAIFLLLVYFALLWISSLPMT